MLIQQSTIGAIWRLCSYSRVLQVHSGGCGRTAEYYRSTREALFVQKSTIEAVGRLCWYYSNTREAVLLKQSTKGPLGKLCWYIRVLYEHLRGCAGTKEY